MNVIGQHHELIHKFVAGNYCPNFEEDIEIKCSQHFKSTKEYYYKAIKKSSPKTDLYPGMIRQIKMIDLHTH